MRSFVRPHHLVLDAGCGTITRAALRGSCRMVVGVDADERISGNPKLDVLLRGDLGRLPFQDKSFDAVMSWMVVEHLDNPQACFAEFARICKDGALIVLATPNLLHYENLVTALTPFGLHNWFMRHIFREQDESFPTRYRANTPMKLVKMMESEGFTTVEMRCIDSGPSYLDWLTPGYAVGLIYHRMVNRFDKLSSLRNIMIGIFRR